jgi:hypothetical protein
MTAPDPRVEAVAKALERELGSFLAHDPAYPSTFWRGASRAVLAALPEPETLGWAVETRYSLIGIFPSLKDAVEYGDGSDDRVVRVVTQ